MQPYYTVVGKSSSVNFPRSHCETYNFFNDRFSNYFQRRSSSKDKSSSINSPSSPSSVIRATMDMCVAQQQELRFVKNKTSQYIPV